MNFSLSFSLHMRASGTEKVSLEEAEVHCMCAGQLKGNAGKKGVILQGKG